MSDAAEPAEVAEDVNALADANAVESQPNAETDQGEPGTGEPSGSSAEKKDSVQDRMDELTRHRRTAERERDYWRQMAMQSGGQQPPQQQTPSEPEPAPELKTLADFDYDEAKYQQHVLETVSKQAETQAVQAARRELEQAGANQSHADRVAAFQERARDFASDKADFWEVTNDPSATFFTESVTDALFGMQDGPAVAYYLASNPVEGRLLAAMSPADAAVELGRISAKVAVPAGKKVSETPDPPETLQGARKPTTIAADTPDSDKLSDAEWLKRRNKALGLK